MMQPNTVLANRYQLIQQLSHKAGRLTFLANDLETNIKVVAKVFQFDQTSLWDEFKLFEREVETLKNLNHPAIPNYLDYFELKEDETHYFVLIQTYIDALSLENLIEEGRKFTEVEVKQLAEGMLNILTYLHEQKTPIIHRDIKPSNILLANRSGHYVGDVYLIDFGAVQMTENRESGTITIVGSYGYMPLEQFSGQTIPASDLYSLGMTLIYLLTGVHPSDLPQEDGQVKLNDMGISPSFVRWLEKITYPYLDERFSSAKIALNALYNYKFNQDHQLDIQLSSYLNLRPADSKVILNRDKNQFKIMPKVESEDSSFILFYCLFFGVYYFFILAYFVFTSLSINEGLMIACLLIFFCSPLIMFLLIFCINSYFYEIIFIDKKYGIQMGTFNQNNGRVKYKKQSSFDSINLIAYNPGYEFDYFSDSKGKVHKRGKVTVKPSLSVYAGSVKYPIFPYFLSQAECWWLAQELSDFLGLKITVIYPTPNVPSKPPEPPKPPEPTDFNCGC